MAVLPILRPQKPLIPLYGCFTHEEDAEENSFVIRAYQETIRGSEHYEFALRNIDTALNMLREARKGLAARNPFELRTPESMREDVTLRAQIAAYELVIQDSNERNGV